MNGNPVGLNTHCQLVAVLPCEVNGVPHCCSHAVDMLTGDDVAASAFGAAASAAVAMNIVANSAARTWMSLRLFMVATSFLV